MFVVIVFIVFYFIPIKIDKYTDAVAQMRTEQNTIREETMYLEGKRHLLEH